MSDGTANRDRAARAGRRRAPDLAAVVVATLLVLVAAFAPVIRETPLRVPVGLLFVLFVPGYAVVAALFPERNRVVTDAGDGDGEPNAADGTEGQSRTRWLGAGTGLDGVDRLSLSVVVSVVLVAAIGVAIHYTPWPIAAGPVVAAVAAVTLLATAIAVRRRRARPASVAFSVPTDRWAAVVADAVRRPDSRTDAALTGLLIVSVVVAMASVGVAVTGAGPAAGIVDDTAAADEADGHSALFLEQDGELLTDESAALEGDERTVTVGIENEEHRTVEYTVVAVAQQLEADGDDVTVADQSELDRREATVEHGETHRLEYELESVAPEDSRVVWLLYPDGAPDEPSTDDAEAYVTLSLPEESEE